MHRSFLTKKHNFLRIHIKNQGLYLWKNYTLSTPSTHSTTQGYICKQLILSKLKGCMKNGMIMTCG
jgi:hypothetical protein